MVQKRCQAGVNKLGLPCEGRWSISLKPAHFDYIQQQQVFPRNHRDHFGPQITILGGHPRRLCVMASGRIQDIVPQNNGPDSHPSYSSTLFCSWLKAGKLLEKLQSVHLGFQTYCMHLPCASMTPSALQQTSTRIVVALQSYCYHMEMGMHMTCSHLKVHYL
jgi:hypothetical protein